MNFQLKWIFFDFGSTIADESKAEEIYFKDILEVFSKHGINKYLEEVVERSKGLIANRNVKTHRELFSLLCKELGIPEQARIEFLNKWTAVYYTKFWKLYPDVINALEYMNNKYNCAILANQEAYVKKLIYDSFKIDKYFKYIFLSGEIGLQKPDLRFFKFALEKAGCKPHEAAYVGDRIDFDIRPAKEIGMLTFLIKRKALFSILQPIDESEKPHFILNSLDEIKKYL
jgi:putative hydrolase of the HAD superfamily